VKTPVMLFRVAGSRAETHHGHLVKSRLECHHRSDLWPIILVWCPYANSLLTSSAIHRAETCCQFFLNVPNAVSVIYWSSFVHLYLLLRI